MKTKKGLSTAVLGIVVASGGAQQVLAQSSSTSTVKESKVLEEVVVTAEHRQASVQDTQISISALTSQDIQDMGISNSTDLGHFAPNVTINSYQGGRTGVAVNMRGMAQNETIVTFDPAVGVYVDDVLISKNVGAMLDVVDLERIEILRGPQGTLYGRNTMGGTVNYVTKKPVDEFEASVTATLGRYSQQDLKAMVNIPLSDTFAMRLSAATINRDGIMKNSLEGAPTDEFETKDRQVALLHLSWKPTDDLSFLYSYDVTRIDEIPMTPVITGTNSDAPLGPTLAPLSVGYGADRPDSVSANHPHQAKTDVYGHSLHIDYSLSDSLSLQSITAYRDMENDAFADSDGSPLPLLATDDLQIVEQFTQEFRLVGSSGGIDFTTGLFFMDEEGDVDVGLEQPHSNATLVNKQDIASFENTNYAIYGQATYALSDQLRLTLGGRYTEEEREMSKVSYIYSLITGDLVPPGQLIPGRDIATNPLDFGTAKDDYNNFSWLASVSYDVNEDTMTYFKLSTGFQSGGFNIRDSSPATFQKGFDEETLLSYEVGIKSDINDRVRVNTALWYSDYDDKRVNNFDPDTLSNTVRNAGVVEIYGAEIEILAQLSDRFRLGANYGYTHPEYKEYDSFIPDPDNPGQTIPVDLSDVTNFPYTPENTAGVNLTYEQQIDIGLLRARIDWAYKDEYNFLAPQPERNYQRAYDIWNARITLDEISGPGDTTMRVSLWGKNLLDEGYYYNGVNIYETFGFDFNLYAEPRTYGLDFEVLF